MSPMLIKEFSHSRNEAHGPTVVIPVNGNITLIEDLMGETLYIYFDARQRAGIKKFLNQLNGTQGEISDIESSESGGKLYYEPSKNLEYKLLLSREQAVHINRQLLWKVHVGRKQFLHRPYYVGFGQ